MLINQPLRIPWSVRKQYIKTNKIDFKKKLYMHNTIAIGDLALTNDFAKKLTVSFYYFVSYEK